MIFQLSRFAITSLTYTVLHWTAPRYMGSTVRVSDSPTVSTRALLCQQISFCRTPENRPILVVEHSRWWLLRPLDDEIWYHTDVDFISQKNDTAFLSPSRHNIMLHLNETFCLKVIVVLKQHCYSSHLTATIKIDLSDYTLLLTDIHFFICSINQSINHWIYIRHHKCIASYRNDAEALNPGLLT